MPGMRNIQEPSDIHTPSDVEVREQLRLMLGCSEFNTSDRNRRFLSYVIEETLAGRSDRIKAYSIAVAAFDRSEDLIRSPTRSCALKQLASGAPLTITT